MSGTSWQFVEKEKFVHESSFSGIVIVGIEESSGRTGLLELPSNKMNQLKIYIPELLQEWKTTYQGIQFKFICPESMNESLKASDIFKKTKSKVKSYPDNQAIEFYLYHGGKLRIAPSTKTPHQDKRIANEGASHVEKKKIKVLIVDDSTTVCKLLKRAMSNFPELEVVGETGRPLEVRKMVTELKPDVMTLDMHMPDMNGVEVLRDLRDDLYVPAVVISSLNMQEGSLVMEALEVGAVDYMKKPSMEELKDLSTELVEKIKIASRQKKPPAFKAAPTNHRIKSLKASSFDMRKWIVIGSSTGGTEAIKTVLSGLPNEIPPMLISQHIPPYFSNAFATRLNGIFNFEVKEAADGDLILPNRVLITPGGCHMEAVTENGSAPKVRVYEGPPIGGHVPSVNVLFESVAKCHARKSIALILTGMGRDGADGMLEMKKAGTYTVGQDEESCVVYGMPKAAANIGATCKQVSLDRMAEEIVNFSLRKSSVKAAS